MYERSPIASEPFGKDHLNLYFGSACFSGFHETELYELVYLEYLSTNSDGGQCFNACNTEYFSAAERELALSTFEKRRDSENPFKRITDRPLEEVIPESINRPRF